MTVAQALAAAHALGLDRLDAQLLLLLALGRSGRDRGWLLAHDSDEISAPAASSYLALCERRAAGEPLAYLTGSKEFHGLELFVDPRVLVPRPDTETLVDWALELLQGFDAPRVVDLGTGSGAIALAIKHANPPAHVTATDSSEQALEVARANAARLQLDVQFIAGSWFEPVTQAQELIVSNPPYIAQGDPHLPALRHEPREALVAGRDGLDAIRTIVSAAPGWLVARGWLLLEHGYDQASAVRSLLSKAGFGYVASRRDLAGIERCTGGQWLEQG